MASESGVSLAQSIVPWTPQENGGPSGSLFFSGITSISTTPAKRMDGYKSIFFEIFETAGGTATLAIQGSLDGSHWYTSGIQELDVATPARVITISATANFRQYWQILDLYPLYRANVTAASSPNLNANFYALPV